MYNIKIDAHTHTIFTKHAFSTISENAQAAAQKGLEALAMTDHFGLWILGFTKKREYELENHIKPSNLPKIMHGIRVYNGIEIDIIDFNGSLAGSEIYVDYMGYNTFGDYILAQKEFVIASLHYFDGFKNGSITKNTQMYIDVVCKKGVDMLGHPARAGIEFDILEVVRAAKAHNTLIEINSEDFKSKPMYIPIFTKIAEICAKENAYICVNSDAHSCFNIGNIDDALDMLESINFPQGLIANRDTICFEAALMRSDNANG